MVLKRTDMLYWTYTIPDSSPDLSFVKRVFYFWVIRLTAISFLLILLRKTFTWMCGTCYKTSKTISPVQVPLYILNACSDFLVPPLAFVFNLSLSPSVFPCNFKTSCYSCAYKRKLLSFFFSCPSLMISNYIGLFVLFLTDCYFKEISTP